MVNRNYILPVHKTEWDRLKKQARRYDEVDPQIKLLQEAREKRKACDETSRKMVQSWREQKLANLKVLKRQSKNDTNITKLRELETKKVQKRNRMSEEAIRKAKQVIFENSCYGRELISALLQSEALEERDLQVKLKKEIMEQAREEEAKMELSKNFITDIIDAHEGSDEKRRQKNKEFASYNWNKHQKQKKEEISLKEQEKIWAKEDAELMKKLLDYEAKGDDKCKALIQESIKEFKEDQKKVKEFRAKRERVDEDIAKLWQKYLDCRNVKEKRVLHEIHHESHNKEANKKNYELLEKLLEEEKQEYDSFIQKGINRAKEKCQDDAHENLNTKFERCVSIAKYNKMSSKNIQPPVPMDPVKPVCYKQSLFTSERKTKNPNKPFSADDPDVYRPPHFLAPHNDLLDELKVREKERSPWNGTALAHAQFEREGKKILNECKYKQLAWKVIQDYRKTNGPNSISLTNIVSEDGGTEMQSNLDK